MWVCGQHLRVKRIDDLRITQDSCIVASFHQLSRASARDTNLIEDELGYVGDLEGIYEINYRVMKHVRMVCFEILCKPNN